MSTPQQKCIGLPEQKCIIDADVMDGYQPAD
jgi:hypothetical protein